ncbi:hypothetical protein [Longimicrobium terrae]|uniref:Serine kinase n=1 Tax=Longimicrobium terrae TaxID=1639882 RepID=A0A841GWC0_9BACT|nr:hypothetical protein [Longimicrobium terrae]MBB4635670.1 hypothetical protein [Longimicrobium terrae]MBB6070064.1 hypothetical protein [Longimicrobium terrae]NNC32968.1 hypothetical protein [Longimicrobium terrae]
MIVRSLLQDGSLRAEIDPALARAAERWLPLIPVDEERRPGARVLRISGGAPADPPPSSDPTLRIGNVSGWVDADGAVLAGVSGLRGTVRLDGGAELAVADAAPFGSSEWDVFTAATLAGALLLGRMGRALVHAAVPVDADGRAWLLVGDTHAGKTTTCANLLQAGWRYVSDDHVILRAVPGGIEAEGWPRPFHLDEGWESGAPLHRRGTTDPHARWPGRWVRSAPLAGLLFPRVEADQPTALERVSAAEALGRLMRQSPWLLADRGAARQILALLQAAAELPSWSLRLGLDSYADPALLADRVTAGVSG